jgi:hypothetical protein
MVKGQKSCVVRIIPILGVAGCALGLTALGLVIMTWQLTMDEFLHAHYLWLISTGRIPHVDFWCHYPVLGYVLLLPLFHMLPESMYSIFVFRFINLALFAGIGFTLALNARHLKAHWVWGALPLLLIASGEVAPRVVEFRTDAWAALLAVLAFTLLFREPGSLRAGLAAGLSVISVLIMPKYLYPLTLANIAYIAYAYRTVSSRRSLLISAIAGGVAGMAAGQLILLAVPVMLWDDLYWSSFLMLKFTVHCAGTEPSFRGNGLTHEVIAYFVHNWWVAVLVAVGVGGWLAAELKSRGVRLWVGTAVLLGVIMSCATGPFPFVQYLVPCLFCLAVFIPYVPMLLKKPFLNLAGTLLLIAITLYFKGIQTSQCAQELATNTAMKEFQVRQSFLDFIPRSERVVGFFNTHPCFREDQTFVTWDEMWGRPRGFTSILPAGSRALACFRPDNLSKSLEEYSPAAIAIDKFNYPPGWDDVLDTFLQTHAGMYAKGELLDQVIYCRKDLVRKNYH